MNNVEMTKVNIHYHLGNERDKSSGVEKHTADRTLSNYKENTPIFNMENAQKDIERAIELEYGIFAVTNSNVMHVNETYELINKYEDQICIIPGVEINLINEEIDSEEKYLHVVVLFDPSDRERVEAKATFLESKIKENCNEPYLKFDQFLDFVYDEKVKCVIAAHGLKQDSRSCSQNPELLSELIGLDNVVPILIEDSKKFHKDQLRIRLKQNLSVSNSDLAWLDKATSISSLDRKNKLEQSTYEYIWGEKTFDDLYFASLMGGHRILNSNDIVPRKNYIKTIKFKSSNSTQIKKGDIELSYGLNTIVGPSGSGKTLLLEILYKKLTGKTLENKSIPNPTNYEDIYDSQDIILLNESGDEISVTSNYKVYEGKNLYNEIIKTYSDSNEELLKKFNLTVDNSGVENSIEVFFKDIDNEIVNKRNIVDNRNKIVTELSRMGSTLDFLSETKISEPKLELAEIKQTGSSIKTLEGMLNGFNEDYEEYIESLNKIKDISKRYNLGIEIDESINNLKENIEVKLEMYELELKIELQEKIKVKNIENKITKVKNLYNSSLGRKIQEYETQIDTFKNCSNNIFSEFKQMLKNEKSQTIPIINKRELLNNIKIMKHDYFRLEKNIKTEVSLDNLYSMLQSSIGNKPRINKKHFSSKFTSGYVDFAKKKDIEKLIDLYVNHDNVISFDYSKNSHNFTTFDIEIKTMEENFQSISKVTAGTLAKIYISYMFENEIKQEGANVLVIYDQPEANMEKRFIHDILSDKIRELRLTSQVIIATHEPLLVVNSDSNQIILSSNEKLISNKNNIKYENVSFVGSKSKSEMIESLANLIDGAPAAVSKRNKIYGGLINNENNKINE